VPVAALEALDRRLQAEMAELAEEVRRRALSGVGLEEIRVRSDGDTTHAFDADVEERLLSLFSSTGLPIRFSSEERPDVDLVSSPELLALVDPLDGSAMVARGYPSGSISVSVVDMSTATPALSRIAEVFTGFQYSALGTTAHKDGRPMHPSDVRSLDKALVVSYFASSSRTELFRRSSVRWEACRMLRNYGGLVDIAKVGSGQCDAMVEALKGFVAREYVAGIHIAAAAGAFATTLDGSNIPVLLDRSARCRFVVAGTASLHEEILRLLAARPST
jgi:fructose-1,6-bisphosphatase/inositol monophosphatase family enzyme